MKFGKLMRATVEQRMPQWRDHVLQYKHLKQVVKKEQSSLQMAGALHPGGLYQLACTDARHSARGGARVSCRVGCASDGSRPWGCRAAPAGGVAARRRRLGSRELATSRAGTSVADASSSFTMLLDQEVEKHRIGVQTRSPALRPARMPGSGIRCAWRRLGLLRPACSVEPAGSPLDARGVRAVACPDPMPLS